MEEPPFGWRASETVPPWSAAVESGADPTLYHYLTYSTPLMEASSYGHLEIVRCLLDHPSAAATINTPDNKGRTALGRAIFNGRQGHVTVVRTLLAKGADPTITDNEGKTPMAMARQHPRPGCVKALKVRCSLRPPPPSPADHAD
jgi:uncharacterized protein